MRSRLRGSAAPPLSSGHPASDRWLSAALLSLEPGLAAAAITSVRAAAVSWKQRCRVSERSCGCGGACASAAGSPADSFLHPDSCSSSRPGRLASAACTS